MRRFTPKLAGRGHRGFTMIEMVIAIAIVGLVLVGLNYFIFSMGELWGNSNERRLFEQHVRSVSRYLSAELRLAGMPPYGSGKEPPFVPAEVRPSGYLSEVLLTFELPAGSRLLSWPERPLPEVVCALQARERDGLFLLWHSRLEEHFDDDPPREVLISPFVTAIAYDYYDEDSRRWTTEKILKKDVASSKYIIPKRLRLTFTLKGWTQERIIPLDTTGEGLPNY